MVPAAAEGGKVVSAFGHDHGDCFDLTPTKLRYWHRHGPEVCTGTVEGDFAAAGLTATRDARYGFWHVTGPGVVAPPEGGSERGCDAVWTALSGLPGRGAVAS